MSSVRFQVRLIEEQMCPKDGSLVFEHMPMSCSLSFFKATKVGEDSPVIPEYVFLLNDFSSVEFDKNDRKNMTFVGPKYRMTFIFETEADLSECLKVIGQYYRLVSDENQVRICNFAPLNEGVTIYSPFTAAVWPEFQEKIQSAERIAFLRRSLPGIEMTGNTKAETITVEQYKALFDNDGKCIDIDNFPSTFYNKDIDPSIVAEVCLLLLKPKYASMTREERLQKRSQNRQKYFEVKQQWKATTPRQWKNNVGFRDVVIALEKDIRNHPVFEEMSHPEVFRQIAFDIFLSLSVWSWDTGSYFTGVISYLVPFLHMFISEVKNASTFVSTSGEELSLDEIEGDIFWCFNLFYDAQLAELVRPSNQIVLRSLMNAESGILHEKLPELLQLLYQKQVRDLSFMGQEVRTWFMDCFGREELQRLWISVLAFSSSFQFFQCFMVTVLYGLTPSLIDVNPKTTGEFLAIFDKLKKEMNLTLLLTNTSKVLELLTGRKPGCS